MRKNSFQRHVFSTKDGTSVSCDGTGWLLLSSVWLQFRTLNLIISHAYISMGEIAYLNMYVLIRRERTQSKVMCFLLKRVPL